MFFSFFLNFGFVGVRREGVNKAKKWPKMTKNSVSLCISGTVPHMIVVFGTHV